MRIQILILGLKGLRGLLLSSALFSSDCSFIWDRLRTLLGGVCLLTPGTPDLEVQGSSLGCRFVSSVKQLYSPLSLHPGV